MRHSNCQRPMGRVKETTMANESNMALATEEQTPQLEYDEIPDPALRERLQRHEERTVSYMRGIQQDFMGMAREIKTARDDLGGVKGSGLFTRWVRRMYPHLTLATAERLVKISDNEDSFPRGNELPPMRVSKLAAYISAPGEVKRRVE